MKTLSGCMITGMSLLLYWMKIQQYILGIGWMSAFHSSAFHEVCDDLQRWLERSQK